MHWSWIGKSLTDQAGSSDWFAGGLITYTNESKTHLAKVPAKMIEKYGAVSLQVAEAMALGAQAHFANCISVAVSGIAGPGGGSVDKPVGTVCIATCLNNKTSVKRYEFKGDRDSVREQTVIQALNMVLENIDRAE